MESTLRWVVYKIEHTEDAFFDRRVPSTTNDNAFLGEIDNRKIMLISTSISALPKTRSHKMVQVGSACKISSLCNAKTCYEQTKMTKAFH